MGSIAIPSGGGGNKSIQRVTKSTTISITGSQYMYSQPWTRTFTFTEVPKYDKLTDDNFVVGSTTYGSGSTSAGASISGSSYNPSTGVLTVNGSISARVNDSCSMNVVATCVYY